MSVGGFQLAYEREVPFEMHVVDEEMIEKVGHSVQCAEEIIVKICIKGTNESPQCVKVELLSKLNYYFLYEHECDVFDFEEMRESQGLTPQFCDYLTMLIKLFN